jgi:hypothetical protein
MLRANAIFPMWTVNKLGRPLQYMCIRSSNSDVNYSSVGTWHCELTLSITCGSIGLRAKLLFQQRTFWGKEKYGWSSSRCTGDEPAVSQELPAKTVLRRPNNLRYSSTLEPLDVQRVSSSLGWYTVSFWKLVDSVSSGMWWSVSSGIVMHLRR